MLLVLPGPADRFISAAGGPAAIFLGSLLLGIDAFWISFSEDFTLKACFWESGFAGSQDMGAGRLPALMTGRIAETTVSISASIWP